MTLQPPRSLGILILDREGASAPTSLPGSMHNPATFGFPVIWETVRGAWAEDVIRGSPRLEPACIAAAQTLVERGAVSISSNCGFFVRHQGAVAAAVNVPVALSSLLLVPTLLRQLPSPAKLAVITADSTHFGEDLLGVSGGEDRARIVVGGIEGGEYWQGALERPPRFSGVPVIETEVAACIAPLRATHPEIAAVLFECATFPMVAPTIRRITNLPVYDITTVCRTMFASIC